MNLKKIFRTRHNLFLTILLLHFAQFHAAPITKIEFQPFKLDTSQAMALGNKIWKNECNGTIAGLTSWNKGEEFPSLGIGHFIWHTPGSPSPFKESFPALITFLSSRGVIIPNWLSTALEHGCPWSSRQHFLNHTESHRMQELRALLANTIPLQTEFMIQRLTGSLPRMISSCTQAEKTTVLKQFNRITQSPNGWYILIDYLNFKGEGVSPQENYEGHRWGLLQILKTMKGTAPGLQAQQEFCMIAKKLLEERVRFSPPERNEARFLPGWFKRIDTYLEK